MRALALRFGVTLAVLLWGVPPVALAGQAPSFRVHTAWGADHRVGIGIGPETRIPLGTPPPLPGRGGDGPIEAPTRRWMLTGMVSVGVNLAPPEDRGDGGGVEGLVHGQVGLLHRTGRSLPNALGVVAVVYLPAGAAGPAAVVELVDLVALQGGALWTRRGWRAQLGASISVRLLRDLAPF